MSYASSRLVEVYDSLLLCHALDDEVLIRDRLDNGFCGNAFGNRKRRRAKRDKYREPAIVADSCYWHGTRLEWTFQVRGTQLDPNRDSSDNVCRPIEYHFSFFRFVRGIQARDARD